MTSRSLDKEINSTCFESQKTVNTIEIIVKMCENCSVQTKKTILIDVNFLFQKVVLGWFSLVWKF